jgi:5'-methylthioadenosine phosphorylase
MLAHVGADFVTHTFVPEVFLAKELQLCYAGVLYVVNYAETGSRHRPFASGSLLGGLTEVSEAVRLAHSLGTMKAVVAKAAEAASASPARCECHQTMAGQVSAYDLPDDWRKWFTNGPE